MQQIVDYKSTYFRHVLNTYLRFLPLYVGQSEELDIVSGPQSDISIAALMTQAFAPYIPQ